MDIMTGDEEPQESNDGSEKKKVTELDMEQAKILAA